MKERLSNQLIGLAIEVHRHLGPGLLESVYETCLCHELLGAGIPFQRQLLISIDYKKNKLDCGFRADIVLDRRLILELKSVEKIHPLHYAQVLTYMKLGGYSTGILLNFNTQLLRDGIKRFVL